MTCEKIRFDKFEFPILKGLEYLRDEEKPVTDYLFVNQPDETFSMYFENGMQRFAPPGEDMERDYFLFELKRPNRKISFFCPERRKNMNAVMWYFYVELFGTDGTVHGLPGQIRIDTDAACIRLMKDKPKFLEVLENVALATT